MPKIITKEVPKPDTKEPSRTKLPERLVAGDDNVDLVKTLEALQDEFIGILDTRFEERDTKLADQRKKEIEDLRAELGKRVEAADDAHRLDGAPPLTDDPRKKGFNFQRACIAIATKNFDLAPIEMEVFREMRKKADASSSTAMMTNPDAAGGFIVPEQYTGDIIEKLEQENPLIALGARILPGIVGSPLVLPKQTGSITATWLPEGKTISRSRPAIGQLTFRPRTLAAMSQYSNVLAENATPAVEAFLLDDIRQQFDNAINNTGLAGDGTDNSPVGISEEEGVNEVDLTGGVTWNKLVTFLTKLMRANAYRGKLGWVMHPAFLEALWQITDATEEVADSGAGKHIVNTQPLERRMLTAGPLTNLMGHPYKTTTGGLAETGFSVAFGAWDQMLIPMWKTLELKASAEAGDAFETDTTLIRALMRADMGVRHAEAFTCGTNFGS